MTIALALACSGFLLGDLPAAIGGDPSRSSPADSRTAGLLGLVHDLGRWVSPEEVVARERSDARLASLRSEYAGRRSMTPGTVEGQRALGHWCDRAGLKAEAIAHFTAVIRLDPEDVPARRRLGYRIHHGRWQTDAEIAAESAEGIAQARADRSWGPRLANWRRWLTEPDRRPEAIRALAEIHDPRAVPSVRRVFGDEATWEQAWAVQVLGRIDAPRSTQDLAELSVFGLEDKIRRSATDRLARRDPRTFVGLLINWLRDPIRYDLMPAALRVEGQNAIVERLYSASPSPASFLGLDREGRPALGAGGRVGEPADGEAQAVRDQQLRDARAIDLANDTIELTNARVERTLARVTGVDLGQSPRPWVGWWTSELGYSYESPRPVEKPVITENVTIVMPRPAITPIARHSCFGAGTPVLSRSGLRPIEDLRVGDQVLSQDPSTGELDFRPIVAVFHNRPAPTLAVALGGETIVATAIHRFWQAGQGWTMARDLRPGDRVRTLGGPTKVSGVRPDAFQPVFNLEVAGGHSFFVGRSRAMVHDNSLVAPSDTPFDAPTVAAQVATGRGR